MFLYLLIFKYIYHEKKHCVGILISVFPREINTFYTNFTPFIAIKHKIDSQKEKNEWRHDIVSFHNCS